MVTGAVGVAAYEALRKMVVKAPLRAATVSVATGFNVDQSHNLRQRGVCPDGGGAHDTVVFDKTGTLTRARAHSPSRRRRRVDAHRRIRPGREDGG